MTVLTPYHVRIDGNIMATYARMLAVVDGLENIPGRRIREQAAAGVDGAYPILDTPSFYGPKRQRLRLTIAPFDADGAVTHTNGPAAHLRENLEAILDIIGGQAKTNHTIDWFVPLPAATKQLQNFARISLPVDTRGSSRLVRRIDITLDYPWPFWRDMTAGQKTIGPFTGAQSFTPLGTAPLADAKFTCTVAGKITHDESGDFIEVTSVPATSVIVDQRPPRSVKQNTGADARDLYNSDNIWGLRFDANTLANLTITGTWQIDYFDSEH